MQRFRRCEAVVNIGVNDGYFFPCAFHLCFLLIERDFLDFQDKVDGSEQDLQGNPDTFYS